jgi:cell division protein FtsB
LKRKQHEYETLQTEIARLEAEVADLQRDRTPSQISDAARDGNR